MATLFFSLLFFFLGYLLGRLVSSSLLWRISLIAGIMSAFGVLSLTELSYFDAPSHKISGGEYFESLAAGFVVFVSILAGGKIGADFRNSNKKIKRS